MFTLKILKTSLFGLEEIIETVKKNDISDIITYINPYKDSEDLYLIIYNKKGEFLFDDTVYEFTEQINNHLERYKIFA